MLLHHCSAAKLCPTLCDSMDRSMPGSSDLCYFLVFAQIHAHAVTAAIFCHSLVFLPSICPSIRVFSSKLALCIKWPNIGVSASASVLPTNSQSWFPLGLTGLISLLSKGLSRVFSSTLIQKHQFFGIQPSLWSKSHICTWLLGKPRLSLYGVLSTKWYLCILIHYLGSS